MHDGRPAPAVDAGEACLVAGTELQPDHSGALHWPAERLLVVADLHLEKGSSFARRRVFLPPYDTYTTLQRLAGAAERLEPRTVIALGDSFHDGEAGERLSPRAKETLAAVMRGRDFLWIAGNHDPAPPKDLGGDVHDELAIGALVFRHEPTGAAGEIAGHLHPVATVRLKGAAIRRRCFMTDGRAMILPAFGAYAGRLCVFDPAFEGLMAEPFSVHLLGSTRTYFFPCSRLTPRVKS